MFWGIGHIENLSNESIVEHILNYGDFADVQELMNILGKKTVAQIFFKQIKKRRNNYFPNITHYFKLYFKKHA